MTDTETIQTLMNEYRKLRGLVRRLTDEEPCRYDHTGFCQEHFCEKPCVHESAKKALKKKGGQS